LDRDGTIIRDEAYIRDPHDVELLPGAAEAIRRLNDRGVAAIIVTNQSGIARGMLTEREYAAVQRRLAALLAQRGARIDATYMCPHHPDFGAACDCRKPGVLLFQLAIAEHGLDAARSIFIGDRWRDISAASAFGGTGVLIVAASTPPEDRARAAAEHAQTAASLREAVDRYVATLPA
jgi:histidinol-phosphate phosphatase family protein